MINHLPITGLFDAMLGLVGSLLIRKRAAVFLSMILVGLFAISAWPVYVYGEKGFDRVYAMSDDDGAAYLKHHKKLAEEWIWVFYVTAAASAVGIAAGLKWPRSIWISAVIVLLLTIGSLVAGGFIADFGGKVRHPEFQKGPPPKDPDENAFFKTPWNPVGQSAFSFPCARKNPPGKEFLQSC
jgi:hypothetical protein